MSSQSSDPRQAPDDEPAGDHGVPDQPNTATRRSWRSIGIAIAVLVIAGGVAAVLFLSPSEEQPKERAAPTRGLACPYLEQASQANDRGDRAAFETAITRAADVAQDTLQTSGQSFGEPERIALELGLAGSAGSNRVERLLGLALTECEDLGTP
jgi:hypothetical protein